MSDKTVYDKLVEWFDIRLGFSKTPLKPIPDFALNPIYWLGLLLALTFVMQGATGILMLFYYTPTPELAYSSTIYIIESVPLGQLVETLHLYTAYAMILLAFMHLARNYFGSAYKDNRILMWLAGIALGVTVLGFGITGYLLPWTVISKSATDVAIGFVNFLPTQLAQLARFFLVGSGSDAAELTNFLHIHTVILPAILLVFLGLKVYMYEVHGPAYVSAYGKAKAGKIHAWFPKIFLYAVMLFSVYIAILLAVASFVPIVLPPAFSSTTAGQYVVQPDWYLLWVYQVLKFQVFEGPFAVYAIALLSILLVLLLLLPFYDRSKRRNLGQRPLFVTIGVIVTVEFIALTIWGYLTPGQVIPDVQAALIISALAVATAAIMWIVYRTRRVRFLTAAHSPKDKPDLERHTTKPGERILKSHEDARSRIRMRQVRTNMLNWFTGLFVLLLAISSASLASLVNMIPLFWRYVPLPFIAAAIFVLSTFVMCRMLKRYVAEYERRTAKK